MNRDFLVIVPTYNEITSIGILLPQLLELNLDILIVDDGSPDGTADACRAFGLESGRIVVVERKKKLGLGSAYKAGFKYGEDRGYKYLIEMDADGSHQVSDLYNLINAMDTTESDLIIGSRWISGGAVKNWARRRQWLSRSANAYARLLLGGKVKDMTAGFRIYRTSKLIQIDLLSVKSEGYCFQIEMTKRMSQIDGKILEVPITFVERKYGVSKMSKKIVFEAIYRVTVWGLSAKFRRNRPS
jgi:glycosyltransferase involved in cell wall biosynthesis